MAAELWRRSGAQWLTAPGVGVPTRLVADVVGLVDLLDAEGARLADVAPAAGLALLAERAGALGLLPSGERSCGGATKLRRCADGDVAITLARDEDLAAVPAWLEVDVDVDVGRHADGDGVAGTGAPMDAWGLVERLVPGRSVGELIERGRLLGLAVAAVGEVGADPVGPVSAVSERGSATARPTAVDRLVVADLASLWAGPLLGHVLARLGARLITVESAERPDGARRTPTFFDTLHAGSECVSLPFSRPEGRRALRELLAGVDVVIEGSRPRALAQLGVDASALLRDGPRLWVSITGYGRTPATAAERVAFGDDAAAAGGLVGRTDAGPRFLADAVADPVTGLVGAATVVDLARQGGRWLVDLPLAAVAAHVAPRPGDDHVEPLPDPVRPAARPS